MSQKNVLIILGGILCLPIVGLFAVATATGSWDRVEMVTERDGGRQLDHKLLSFIPYSEQVMDPGLTVTKDGLSVLTASKLKNLPEAVALGKGSWVSRERYRTSTMYVFSIPTKQSQAAIISSYAVQLKEVKGKPLPATTSAISGTCPDGKSHVQVLYDPSMKRLLLELTPRTN